MNKIHSTPFHRSRIASGTASADPISERLVKVLLVDDHPTFREGLKSMIKHIDGMVVSAEADSERAAMQELENNPPDMMIVDLNLGKDSGLRLIQRARHANPELRILVASMYEESMFGERAIIAGANGYICKHDEPESVMRAIETILRGECYISRGLVNRLVERNQSSSVSRHVELLDTLTEREMQVFSLIGNGFSTKEIATKLHISPKTVDAHRDHVKRKIGVSDSTRLVHRAVEWVLSQ